MLTASQVNITPNTPMGANLIAGGATFRTWAPNATEVYIAIGYPTGTPAAAFPRNAADLLVNNNGYWTGFVPGVTDGTPYRFFVVGLGAQGFKRDPYARELEFAGYPDCNCIVRDPTDYPWHDAGFRPPKFHELSVYQFHFGVYYARDAAGTDKRSPPRQIAKFLDAIDRIEYWADLGINAVMPLPFHEFATDTSRGYNGIDIFSPEMTYSVQVGDLASYLPRVNRLINAKGQPGVTITQITGQHNQFKAFVDLCHLYGIAVIADVVYNHAGGGMFYLGQSIYYYDLQADGDETRSLFCTPVDIAGGRAFSYRHEVCQFLIDNGKFLLSECHLDGLRFDEVTQIDWNGGWFFAQDLTNTLRAEKPEAIQIAEYWGNAADRWKGIAAPPFGMGFDAGYSDVLRKAIRGALGSAATGREGYVNLDVVSDALYMTFSATERWRTFQGIENHDLVDFDHQRDDPEPRIAAFSGRERSREPLPRKRSKVATGLLLTAPGIPMIFMGQEFLEDKFWLNSRNDLLVYWDGLDGPDPRLHQKQMSDQHRFTRDLMWLRRRHPALMGEGIQVVHIHNDNRVIAFQRWLPGIGRDVMVIVSLNETTFYDHSYRIGFPASGQWYEVFNSDVYDTWVNPEVQGNGGGIVADGPPWNNMPTSANITLPAISILVFARDQGDL